MPFWDSLRVPKPRGCGGGHGTVGWGGACRARASAAYVMGWEGGGGGGDSFQIDLVRQMGKLPTGTTVDAEGFSTLLDVS